MTGHNGEVPMADEWTVREGLERLRSEFLRWVNERALAENEVSFPSAHMTAHNFYKLIMFDLADKMGLNESERRSFYAIGLKRLTVAMLAPEESDRAEAADSGDDDLR